MINDDWKLPLLANFFQFTLHDLGRPSNFRPHIRDPAKATADAARWQSFLTKFFWAHLQLWKATYKDCKKQGANLMASSVWLFNMAWRKDLSTGFVLFYFSPWQCDNGMRNFVLASLKLGGYLLFCFVFLELGVHLAGPGFRIFCYMGGYTGNDVRV